MKTNNALGIVTQLHYQGWPDHGVPDNTDALLSIHKILREFEVTGPVVVHCSAGVGKKLFINLIRLFFLENLKDP